MMWTHPTVPRCNRLRSSSAGGGAAFITRRCFFSWPPGTCTATQQHLICTVHPLLNVSGTMVAHRSGRVLRQCPRIRQEAVDQNARFHIIINLNVHFSKSKKNHHSPSDYTFTQINVTFLSSSIGCRVQFGAAGPG